MIEITHRDDVVILTMGHGKANAFDLEFSTALTEAFDECGRSPAKAVVVTARGAIFSAGVDLLRVVSGGAPYLDVFLPALSRTFESVFTFPKPVVAAINGHALAGGCILACAADRRLMARGTGRIGVPEVLVGVPFPTVPLEIVRFAVASQHLSTLVYGGDALLPDEARERGLVDAVVDGDRLVDEAVAAALKLASLPPAVFTRTKQQLREPAVARMREGKARVDPDVYKTWALPDTLAGIRGYVARTFKK
jgi:enoyl-CoA hydratase